MTLHCGKYHFFSCLYYNVADSELLARTGIKQLNTEIKKRRWKFIGHTLKQEPDNCNTAPTWTPEGRRKQIKNHLDAHSGEGTTPGWDRQDLLPKTGQDGEARWKPYVPPKACGG